MSWASITCCTCRVAFYVTQELEATLRRTEQIFYCPHGHQQHFPRGPSEADKLRQERDRLKQRLAEKDDEIAARDRRIELERGKREHEKRRVAAAKGQVTRLKNRAAAGVCPCCTRHFDNLQRHMTTKHPDFPKAPQDADKVARQKATAH